MEKQTKCQRETGNKWDFGSKNNWESGFRAFPPGRAAPYDSRKNDELLKKPFSPPRSPRAPRTKKMPIDVVNSIFVLAFLGGLGDLSGSNHFFVGVLKRMSKN
jgi:hypothetical protein